MRIVLTCLLRSFLLSAACLATFSPAVAEDANSAAGPTAEQIAAFEKSLSGAALVGRFTVTGAKEADPKPERYELTSVKHFGGDNFMFAARIVYGDHDVQIPITLPVKWAGDTPVITVDNIGFPGLGTYSARVMIYQDHYAGFWSGADHGGHLFGQIERSEKKSEQPK